MIIHWLKSLLMPQNPVAVSTADPLPVQVLAPAVATNKATIVRGLKAPAAIGTPEALAAAGTFVQTVTIWALRAARVANTGSVFVDTTSANDAQLIELTPAAYVTFTAPPGKVIDLADIFVDAATLTDGVLYVGML